jgi:hypothetical protein
MVSKFKKESNVLKTIMYSGHKIQTPGMSLTGKEEVKYDDRIVSSKYSMLGATHIFSVQEDDENIQYEIELGTRWHGLGMWTIVRRNGVVIYSDR